MSRGALLVLMGLLLASLGWGYCQLRCRESSEQRVGDLQRELQRTKDDLESCRGTLKRLEVAQRERVAFESNVLRVQTLLREIRSRSDEVTAIIQSIGVKRISREENLHPEATDGKPRPKLRAEDVDGKPQTKVMPKPVAERPKVTDSPSGDETGVKGTKRREKDGLFGIF